MGKQYFCFTDNKAYDNDVDVCTGYYYRGSEPYIDEDTGEEFDRYGSETFFCPEHDPGDSDPDWEAIPNFDIEDYT